MTNQLITHIADARVRQKGRRVPELPTFMFGDVGVEVHIRRLGPFTMDEIRKTLRKQRQPPTVPTVNVEIGEMRVKVAEPNPHDPNYLRELQEYNTWLSTSVGEKMIDLMVNYCIVCDVEEDVVEERRQVLELIDPEINSAYNDREVYVRHYLLSSTKALEDVQNFILGRSMPTQEAVEEHIESFPGDVQGEATVSTPGAPIRLPV